MPLGRVSEKKNIYGNFSYLAPGIVIIIQYDIYIALFMIPGIYCKVQNFVL